MKEDLILFWNDETKCKQYYYLIRKIVFDKFKIMSLRINKTLDLEEVFEQNDSTTVLYPVFCNSTGWWGEFLGRDFIITEKIIITSNCQIMVIKKYDNFTLSIKQNKLFAAEVLPSSNFFKKINSIAVINDMLATDSGTILTLLTGNNQNSLINILNSTGNSFLGCIGGF